MGVALVGVVIFPVDGSGIIDILHLFFAIIFFLGSAVVIFFIHDPEDKWKSRLLAVASIVCLVIAYFDNSILSLFGLKQLHSALLVLIIY